MRTFEEAKSASARTLLEDVMAVWEFNVTSNSSESYYGSVNGDIVSTDSVRYRPTTADGSESGSANADSASWNNVNISRKSSFFTALDDPGYVTDTRPGSSQQHRTSHQGDKDNFQSLQGLNNSAPSEQLTSQSPVSKPGRKSKLYTAVNNFRSIVEQICHPTDKTAGQYIDKASIKGPFDFRRINRGVTVGHQASSYNAGIAQTPTDKAGSVESKAELHGRYLTDTSESQEDDTESTLSHERFSDSDIEIEPSVEVKDWPLRGGGGTLFSLAAKRDKYRNGSKSKTKTCPPKLGVLRKDKVVPLNTSNARSDWSGTADQMGQPSDVFRGLWHGHYRAASEIPNEVPLNSVHWWLSGGRPGANSKPRNMGHLREMRKASDKVTNRTGDWSTINRVRKPRAFWREFGYSVTGGRYASGRDSLGGDQWIDQNEEVPHPVYLRRAAPVPSGSRESGLASGPAGTENHTGAHEATDRVSSRSRATTWSESSGTHSPQNPTHQ